MRSSGTRTLLSLAAALPLLLTSGCVFTVAGAKPPPISAQAPPAAPPRVEHSVGDFAFTLEGGKLVSSHFVGKSLSDEIMAVWTERGYITAAQFVESGTFTRTADYDLTLSGSQYGDSSILMQLLSGLTLTLLPYTVEQNYDLQYVLEDVRSGAKYTASIEADDKAWVQLFLLLALPFGGNGHKETMRRVADHLYEQFRAQGAFQPAVATAR